MVVHTCNRCQTEFNKKSSFLVHINRKKPCNIKEINIAFIPQKNTENNEINVEIPQNFECKNCFKIFSRKDALKRHDNTGCKVKKEKEKNENKLLQKIENLEKENKLIKEEINIIKATSNNKKTTKIINNNNTINNNINIINLTDFDKPLNHQTIGKKIFFDSISNHSGLKPLLDFITYVHKNDNVKLLPYKNVKITDLGRNLGQIVKNNKWEVEDANDIVNKVVDDTYNYFEVQYETNEDEIDEKPANIKNKFKRFKKFYFCMRGPEFFEMNDDGDRIDDDGQLVTPNDFKNGKLFEVKLKKKAKMILKE
jgi:CHAT domain-containing protein